MAQTLMLTRETQNNQDTLAEEVNDPMVIRAAQHLITRHRVGQGFDINAFDVPHEALADISAQLEDIGMSHALADPLIQSLRRYVMANGGSFVRAANAKPVVIRLTVANAMPDRRFDNGMTELACIGATQVKVEGASAVNVRATPSGTATTSNAANIDAMFSNVKGLHLWVRFEAPTKADLDGLMTTMEGALAGVAQSIGGAMGAADFKKLLETLQKEGALTPAVMALVNNLIALQEGMKQGAQALSQSDIAAIVKEISTLIADGQAQGLIPPALVAAVMASMTELSSNSVIAAFLVDNGVTVPVADNDNLTVEQRLENLMEKVEALQNAEGVDPALKQQLTEMLADMQKQLAEGTVEVGVILNSLSGKLVELAARENLPAAVFTAVGEMLPEIAALKETVQANAPVIDLAQGEALLAMLEDVAAQVEKGDVDLKNLPPELQALIEKMGGVETILQEKGREARIETLAQAIVAQGDPQMSETVHAAVLALASPQALAALPPETVQAIQNFISENQAIVEISATQTVIRDMTATLQALDPASAEATDMRNAIEMLKADGLQAIISKEGQALLSPAALQVVQSFAKDHPAVVEIVATQSALRDITTVLESVDPSSPQAAEIKQAMEMIKDQGITAFVNSDLSKGLPPETAKIVDKFIEQTAVATALQTVEGTPHHREIETAAVEIQKQGIENFVASGGLSTLSVTAQATLVASLPSAAREGMNFDAPPAPTLMTQVRAELAAINFVPPAPLKGQTMSAVDKVIIVTAQRLQENLAKVEKQNGPVTAKAAAEILRDVKMIQDRTTDPVKKEQLQKIENTIRQSVVDSKNLEKEISKTPPCPCGTGECKRFNESAAPKDQKQMEFANKELARVAQGFGKDTTITQHKDGAITFKAADGRTQRFTSEQVAQAAVDVQRAEQRLSQVQQKFISNEALARALERQKTKMGESNVDTFNHVCGANCNHGTMTKVDSDLTFADISASELANDSITQAIGRDFDDSKIDYNRLNLALSLK
jgi:hypothetical protein